MRILIHEEATGGGYAAPPPALMREGGRMAGALARDLAAVPGVEVWLTRDARLPMPALPARILRRAPDELRDALPNDLRRCDAFWPIAPETDGRLERLCALAARARRTLLNSAAPTVRVCASKFDTVRRLARAGVPCVQTWRALRAPRRAGLTVVKPDGGVGSEGVAVRRGAPPPLRGHVAQPFTYGTAASLSLACLRGRARLLSLNAQRVSLRADALRLEACVVGGLRRRALAEGARLAALADAVAAALPGLAGFVGVDLMLTAAGPRVLEINPRLTSAYPGLAASLHCNPAALILDMFAGRAPPRRAAAAWLARAAPVEMRLA